MLKKVCIIAVLLLIPGLAFGAPKFGMVFDIEGTAVLTTARGKTITLNKARHLLKPIREGDKIEVSQGKVVIVSLKDKKGYEILANSIAQIKDKTVLTIKGTVTAKAGLRAPTGAAGGPIGSMVLGAIVLRSPLSVPCISTVSPINSAILTLTPVLKWALNCKGAGTEVSVKVLAERKVIFETSTESTSVKVPDGVLEYGETYRWLVDGGPYGIMGGTFSVPEKDKITSITEDINHYKKQDDLSQRISYIFFLHNNRLNEYAAMETEKLQREFPENEYIREVQ